jgi:hypothetical protein
MNTAIQFRHRRRNRSASIDEYRVSPDERERTELPGDGIPHFRPPEVETELLDRQHRLPRQLEPDCHDNRDEHESEHPGAQTESEIGGRQATR